MTRFADLPAADQKLIRSGRTSSPRRPGLTTPAHQDRGGGTYTCHPCGQTFPTYPKAERHVDAEHGHGMIGCSVD